MSTRVIDDAPVGCDHCDIVADLLSSGGGASGGLGHHEVGVDLGVVTHGVVGKDGPNHAYL